MPGKARYKNESKTSYSKRIKKKGKSRKKANKAAKNKYGKSYK